MACQLSAGSAEVVITPPLGISMAGYYHDRRADEVHDDLFAKALVLSSAHTSAAIVVCDLIGLPRAITRKAREIIAQRPGIPSSQVMIMSTHTHTGPVTTDQLGGIMRPDSAYLDVLTRRIADAVHLAFRQRQPVCVEVGSGQVEGIAFNRRYWMKDGTLRTNPPLQSPDIEGPAGPIDPELGILVLRDAHGDPLAVVTSYALHPDQVGGTAFCADYQGAESKLLKQVLGTRCVVLCPNGCCGDINHLEVSRPGAGQKGFAVAERSGTVLAGEMLKQLSVLEKVNAHEVRAGTRIFEAPLRAPSPEDVAWARQAVGGDMHGFDEQGLDVVRAYRMLRVQESGLSRIPVEISALAVGDVAFVGLPGEVFVAHGLAIKEQSPFAQTFVAELCNDSIGYVPTQSAYSEGGYEATASQVVPGTGERMVDTALELLRDLAKD